MFMPKPVIHQEVAEVESLYIVGGKDGSLDYDVSSVQTAELRDDGITSWEVSGRDRHIGSTRTLHTHQSDQAWANREIRNDRQVSVLLETDLLALAKDLEIHARLEAEGTDVVAYMASVFAGNIVLRNGLVGDEGILKNYLGPGTKLLFGEPVSGSILTITEALLPCTKPATRLFADFHSEPDFTTFKEYFKNLSHSRRGYSGMVLASGMISVGDSVALQLPIDHRVIIPGWDMELNSTELLKLGIRDVTRLSEKAGLSSKDVGNLLEARGYIVIHPRRDDEKGPGEIDEVLGLCGIGGDNWGDYLTMAPRRFDSMDEQVSVSPHKVRVNRNKTIGHYMHDTVYAVIRMDDEHDSIEGKYTFNNGNGISVIIELSNTYDRVYSDNEDEESQDLWDPNFVIKIGRSDAPEFATIEPEL